MPEHKATFLPSDLTVTSWERIEPFFTDLLSRDIDILDDLKQWLLDWSTLEGTLEEELGWRYIHASCNTADAAAQERYAHYHTTIMPQVAAITNQLHEKVLQAKAVAILRQEAAFDILFRKIENSLRCYRKENIPIQTEIQLNQQKFAVMTAAMTIKVTNKTLTLQQAAAHLESTDRALRKEVYDKIQQRRLQDKEALDALYTTLVQKRHKIALNAGFENFRDYSFVAMHRFDYTAEDCYTFHEAIREEIVPLLNELAIERKQQLGLDRLQPFDHAVDIHNRAPLRPFQDATALVTKTTTLLQRLGPFFADCLRTMEKMGHLDLSSRKDKAPGGFSYPLMQTGVPFIFMNAASTVQDVLTMLHECGHAFHSFLIHKLPLNAFKHYPMEIAELASMAMELLTMAHWDVFFPDAKDLNRVKKEHLIHVIAYLPWMAAIDAFQHWVYTHPNHTHAERRENWNRIFTSFSDNITDWSGYEEVKDHLWQKQLHLFEVPFYYIEYAIAQLGAIGVWIQAQENLNQALQNYTHALQLGYTASIRDVYQTAGVRFDFNRQYIRTLAQHVRSVWEKL